MIRLSVDEAWFALGLIHAKQKELRTAIGKTHDFFVAQNIAMTLAKLEKLEAKFLVHTVCPN